MPEDQPPAKPRRRSALAFAIAGVAIIFVLWLVHAPALSWTLEKVLSAALSSQRLTLEQARVDVRIGSPVRLTGVVISGESSTRVAISKVEVSFAGLNKWFAKAGRPLERVTIAGVDGFIHAEDLPAGDAPATYTPPDLRWLPLNVELANVSLEFAGPESVWTLRNFSADFRERATGRLEASELIVRKGDWVWRHGAFHALTAWKNGTLWLGELEVRPEVVLEALEVDLIKSGGPALSVLARVFGGTFRGDLVLGERIDAAFWLSNIPLAPLPALAGISERVSGRIAEGRLTFRGDPARPADAEASMRLFANDFRWNDRGWESLEVGASLIHQRLMISDFDLRQKDNHVKVSGEISIAEGWSQIAKAPFLLNVSAKIEELGALGGLIGGPFDEVAGRMSATGSVSGRDGKLDGFLSLESSGIRFRNLPVSALKVETVFRGREVEIAQCEIYSGGDLLEARGTVNLSAPHTYAGEVKARIGDVAKFLRPFRAPGADEVYSGALRLRWQGDGTRQAHSGAFDLVLSQFVSDATPTGLTGEFAGTYSPENIYFGKIAIENAPMRIDSRATIADSGITLSDLTIRAGANQLLTGSVFVPVDTFAILRGTAWQAAIDGERESYIRLASPRPIPLRELLQAAGQEPTVEGSLAIDLELRGKPGRLKGAGSLDVGGIRFPREPDFPASRLALAFEAADGQAAATGEFATKGFSPIKVSAAMPFGLEKSDDDTFRWVNPDGKFEAKAAFPKTDLSVFRPFLPEMRRLSGDLAGDFTVTGTLAAPEASGRITLRKGLLEVSTRTPAITDINATIVFAGNEARIETFRGDVGAGPFDISGRIGFPGPSFDIKAKGTRVLLARDRGMRLRANIDLGIEGVPGAGRVTGSVRLVDGRIYRRLEITPLLIPSAGPAPVAIASPVPANLVPPAFAPWTLNVKLTNETPFLLKGNLAEGEIIPEVTLEGTLGRPVPVGRITLRNVRAFLPFTTMTIPDGRVDFLPDTPWVPMLDIRGVATTPDYEVHLYALGAITESRLILRSEPPLSQEALLLLLTTGIAPGATSGSGFSDAAIGQGSLFMLRTLARDVQIPGIDVAALVNRFNISAAPAQSPGERPTLRGTLELWEPVDVMLGRDGYGFYQAGATYTWRFR